MKALLAFLLCCSTAMAIEPAKPIKATGDLPVIPAAAPVVVPAQPAVTYSQSALATFSVTLNPTDTTLNNQQLNATFVPYTGPNGTIAPLISTGAQAPEQFIPKNVWAEAQRSTLFAQIMGGVVQYAQLAIQEQRLNAQIASLQSLIASNAAASPPIDNTANNVVLATAQAGLVQIQAGMGVTPAPQSKAPAKGKK